MLRKVTAEFIGTAWLVLGGCGSAVLAAAFPQLGIGFVGVSLAFGLTVLTMAFAIGHVSGCHLNPAVSVGLWAGGRFKASELPFYIIAQVLGAFCRCCYSLCNRKRKGGLRRSCRLRQQRLWRSLAGWIFDGGGPRVRSGDDLWLRVRDLGFNSWKCPAGFCPHCYRPLPHVDPSHQYSGDQHLSESCT